MLLKMIQDKVSLIENTNDDPAKNNKSKANSKLYAGALEDKLQAKIQKIYKNGELDNKEKVKQMAKIYEEEVIVEYENAYRDVISFSSDDTIKEYLVEFTHEKAKIGENIL